MDSNLSIHSAFDPKKPMTDFPRPSPTQPFVPLFYFDYLGPISWPRLPLPRTPSPSPPSSPDRTPSPCHPSSPDQKSKRKVDEVEHATPLSPKSEDVKMVSNTKKRFSYSPTTDSPVVDIKEWFPSYVYESPEDTEEDQYSCWSGTIFKSGSMPPSPGPCSASSSGSPCGPGPSPPPPGPCSASAAATPCAPDSSTTPSPAKVALSGQASPSSPGPSTPTAGLPGG